MGPAEILALAGEGSRWVVVTYLAVLTFHSRPAHAVGWVLSTEIRDRYLRWKHVPDDERLRLIKHGAELEVDQGPTPQIDGAPRVDRVAGWIDERIGRRSCRPPRVAPSRHAGFVEC